ncbi:TadE/TadG family type IV pilus assembly protein [Desulfofalx alkaliphila]|uniref:TadE/TadG family type IV pilus assembly protein n=1 Tax=Desulfofalx alkaliphila TaxID=105483 RepID=UPI0004E0C7B5|nr:TadE/TadG family type IV pilus assembly protein [Desulfofalx alkaliphila]
MKSISDFLKNQQGYAYLMTLIAFPCILMLAAMAIDIGHVAAAKMKAQNSINLALRAACQELDEEALQDPIEPQLVILPNEARLKFNEVLQKNLNLDAYNNPMAGSFAAGKVIVNDFKVFNTVPDTYTYGSYTEHIDRVCISAVITVPIKLTGFARISEDIPTDFDLVLHSTVGPEFIPQI